MRPMFPMPNWIYFMIFVLFPMTPDNQISELMVLFALEREHGYWILNPTFSRNGLGYSACFEASRDPLAYFEFGNSGGHLDSRSE